MLILTRKVGESIIIDDNIEVCIIEASDGNIKLGIKAPKNIKVFRKELLKEIKEENVESVKNIEDIMKLIK